LNFNKQLDKIYDRHQCYLKLKEAPKDEDKYSNNINKGNCISNIDLF